MTSNHSPPGWVFVDYHGAAWGYSAIHSHRTGCMQTADGPFATEHEAREHGAKCCFTCVDVMPWTPQSGVPARKYWITP